MIHQITLLPFRLWLDCVKYETNKGLSCSHEGLTRSNSIALFFRIRFCHTRFRFSSHRLATSVCSGAPVPFCLLSSFAYTFLSHLQVHSAWRVRPRPFSLLSPLFLCVRSVLRAWDRCRYTASEDAFTLLRAKPTLHFQGLRCADVCSFAVEWSEFCRTLASAS